MNATNTTTTTDPKKLAGLVQQRMSLLRLNVTTAARAAGIQRSGLSAWLHGRRELRAANLLRLLNTLGLVLAVERPHRHQRRRAREGCGCC